MTQVGSTAYMSPERLKGDEYGYPSDVWSIGVLLIECAQAMHPLAGVQSYFELVSTIATGPPPWLAQPSGGSYVVARVRTW